MRATRVSTVLILLVSLAVLHGSAWAGLAVGNFRKEKKTGYADVTYTNDSGTVLVSVKVECIPPGEINWRRHVNLYYSDHLKGGIQPGFTATQTISFPLHDKDARPEDLSCEAHELRLRTP